MTNMRAIRSVVTTAIAVCLFAFIASCGSGGDSGTGAGASGTITLEVSATSIPADGSSSVIIKATVKDSAGNPVRHYTDVMFSTNLGHFKGGVTSITLQTQPPLVDGKPDRTAPPTGIAEVTFTAGTTPGVAKVTVSSNSVSQAVYITITGGTAAIKLEKDPEEPILADGKSSATITATLTDSAGAAVTPGTSVTFTTTLGTFSNGSTTYTVTTPDSTGVVNVSLIAGTTPGKAKVTATSNSVSQQIEVTFLHAGNTGVPVGEAFSLAAAYVNISGLWVASLADTITASVGDVYGNAVKDSTIIAFKTYNTGGYFGTDMVPTDVGKASSILYSAGTPTPLQGFVSLTGETQGGSTTRVTALEAVPYPDYNIMYAGTNGGGVYKSTDYGATWETVSRSTENPKQGQNLIDPYIKGHSAIAVDPDNHNAVYVGTGYLGKGNVYRSLDGGMNWNSNNVEQWNGLYNTTAAVLTVLCDGDDDSTTDYPYVWIGTEGLGPLYATDGKTFQPSGSYASTPVPGTGNVGNGTMSQPVVSYTAKSETWTATYTTTAGTATTPVFSGTGDGSMSTVTTSATTKTENWTVQNTTTAGTVTKSRTTIGDVVDINVIKSNAASEKWTLTCTSAGSAIGTVTGTGLTKGGNVTGISADATHTKTETFTLICINPLPIGSEKFSVTSSLAGTTYDDATVNVPYGDNGLTFTITKAAVDTPYVNNDTFTFTSTVGGTFSVHSSEVGYYPDAAVGTAYTNSAISFQINQGPTAFIEGDYLYFTTTTAWQVVGTVSGAQTASAITGTAYTSDNREVGFTITEGATAFVEGDKFTFSTTAGLTYWTVSGSVSGTQTNRAYDGQGYYSDGDEVYFLITAGTTAFANGDTFTFTVTASDLTYGWTVWDMVRVPDTHGATAILYAGTAVGVYKSTDGAKTWSSLTSFTGDYVIALALYPTATGGSSDIIYAGTQNGGVWVSTNSGSTWTQYSTGMDEGKGATIKDLLVDPANHRLYAIAYTGPADQATGNLYAHALNSNGTMTSGQWSKANTGLSGSALHALASNIPSSPTALFVGGEGISLYKATSGLDTGDPSWAESKSGLSNLLMARMPILFSGGCTMTVSRTQSGSLVSFTVYIQDVNGNPPITGSTFTATHTPEAGTEVVLKDITYADSYTAYGTFRDPADVSTKQPYTFSANVSTGDQIELVFTPANTLPDVPGSSGSTQSVTYTY
ncbi:MAG: invasin domain 3-containing protein [Pseudomonadota bacterium]